MNRGGSLIEVLRHAHDEVALEPLFLGHGRTERVAYPAHALREPCELELPAELAREELGDLVLESLTILVGKRQIVGISADPQHLVFLAGQR